MNNIHTQRSISIYTFFLLSVLICIIYSNTLNASWHFDDEPNILLNSSLHLTDLSLESIYRVVDSSFIFSGSGLYRPVTCFTFALNWYFGQDDPSGYHIVNISIHIATAFFIFLVILQIMHLIDAIEEENSRHYFIALLGAALWATAPIQTQAVTYIVQRMASLAAMFTILAIYSYLKARTEKQSIHWAALTLFFFLCGIGSKENAVILPGSLVLLEFSFFSHRISTRKTVWIAVTSLAILLVGFLATHFIFGRNLLNIFDPVRLISSYEGRSFSLQERILTEPRIILMYLSQIFVPLVSRFSLVHDIQLSISLFTPWTTLPAIAIIFTSITLSFIFLKKYPLFAFPILFFFLNHAVESTILPLELVFEHRNYLPSFFLFLPLSFLIAEALYLSNKFSPVGRFVIAIGSVCFLILSGHATYTRNFVWENEGTLWTDAIKKAPSNPRAAGFLGKWYQENGQYKESYYYFQQSLYNANLAPTPSTFKLVAIQAIGDIHYELKEYRKASSFFTKCIEIKEKNEYCLTRRAESYLQLNLPKEAIHDAKILVKEYPFYLLGKYIAASASYQLGDMTTAQNYMQEIIRKSLNKPKGLYLMGVILLKYKSYPTALFFLRKAADLWPSKVEYQFTLATAYYINNQLNTAEETLRKIFVNHPLPLIEKSFQNFISDAPNRASVIFTENVLAEMLKAEINFR